MRNRSLILPICILFLLAAYPAFAGGGCASCLAELKLPSSVSAAPMTTVTRAAFTFTTTVSGAGVGNNIADGVYNGWCGDTPTTPVAAGTSTVYPRSSYSAEALAEYPNWPLVNYLLNHKIGTNKNDIQNAMWFLLTGQTRFTVTANTQAMIDDAVAHGQGFVPTAGQLMAVVLWYDGKGSYQDTFIEIPTPNTGRIGDRVWKDLNRNGIQDAGEPGIDGVSVTLTGPNGTTTATTANGGSYSFTGLAAGTYTVTVDESFVASQNLVRSPSGDGSASAVDSDSSPVSVTIADGENIPTIDFGYMPNCAGVIGDFIWHDYNRDGVQDAGEPRIDGVRVLLNDLSGNKVQETITVNGQYRFTGVCSGSYSVAVDTATLSPNFTPTTPLQGSAAADSNGSPAPITLPAFDSQDLTVDFGFVAPCNGTIGSVVWHDLNWDGLMNDGIASGINGVIVSLTGNGLNLTTTTATVNGQPGVYQFTGLCPGTYTVAVGNGVPTNWTPTPTAGGGDQSVDTKVSPVPVELSGGTPSTDKINFGFTSPCEGGIGRLVWNDLNHNGLLDPGEPGLAGVVVTLYNFKHEQLATTTTDANGVYGFTGLCQSASASPYSVEVTPPATFVASPVVAGGNVGSPVAVTLGIDEVRTTVNFSYYQLLGSLSGTAYTDLNGNSQLDSTDTKLGGVTVTLAWTDAGGAPQTTTAITAADGSYSFLNLVPATYKVNAPTLASGENLSTAQLLTVTVLAGSAAPNNDFGYVTGTISGYAYKDSNTNKAKDSGETPLANVVVTLKDGNGATVAATLTGADGSYSFNKLAAGTYSVDTAASAQGLALETTNPLSVTLPAGGNSANNNFGYIPGAISGYAYKDANTNLAKDAGEAVLAGVEIKLKDSNGAVVATAITGADGAYNFGNLSTGNYTVSASTPASGLTLETAVVLTVGLAAGSTSANNNFGYVGGTISGYAYQDKDLDKAFDSGEPALSGVAITLKDSKGAVVATANTDASGSYSFTGLLAGTYTVSAPSASGSLTLETSATLSVTLAAGGASTKNNFGYIAGSISGYTYTESNCNKIFDAGELPLPGVTVTLKNASGAVVSTAVTAADGSYSFTGLGAGTYTVSVPSTASGENLKTTSPLSVTLTAGGTKTNVNFGYDAGSISGKIFADCDRDKQYDSGEAKLAGVTLTLNGTDVTGKSITKTTVSGTDGVYTFTGVPAGTYTVTAPQLASGQSLETTNPLKITLSAGQDSANNNFGYVLSIISGKVYVDANGNRAYDSGETTLSGAVVTLTGKDLNGKTVTATATTDCSGSYTFKSLLPGNYVVTAPATVSSKVIGTTNPLAIAITTGAIYANNNFGYGTPVTVTCVSGSATLGVAYSSSVKASGGYSPYTYSVSSGSLPGGLSLNASTGAITGTPTSAGTFSFTAKATDSHSIFDAESCSIVVGSPLPAVGAYTTYTQGGWGASPNGNNPAALLEKKFSTVYPSGSVSIGGKYDLIFKSTCAIKSFLPAGGTAAMLSSTATNPSSSAAGVFAGQVLALQLNVDFSKKGITPAGLANLKVVSGKLAGYTVQQVLDLANAVLGGTSSALPSGLTLSELNSIVDAINNNFDGGTVANGFLK